MKAFALRFNVSGFAVDIRTTDDPAMLECALFVQGQEGFEESFTLPVRMFADFFDSVKENRV